MGSRAAYGDDPVVTVRQGAGQRDFANSCHAWGGGVGDACSILELTNDLPKKRPVRIDFQLFQSKTRRARYGCVISQNENAD